VLGFMKLEFMTLCWGEGGCEMTVPLFELDTDDDFPEGPRQAMRVSLGESTSPRFCQAFAPSVVPLHSGTS
jgi:hypothetical protein